jgi:hypothetical protein
MWPGTILFESIVLGLTENYLTPCRGPAASSQELVQGLSSVQRGDNFCDSVMLDGVSTDPPGMVFSCQFLGRKTFEEGRGPAQWNGRKSFRPNLDGQGETMKLRMGKTIWTRGSVVGTLVLVSLVGTAATASAQVTVGGHVGSVIPWVTRAGGQTTSIADNFQIGFPIGVTFKGQGRMALDLEMVPSISDKPRAVGLTVDPGVVWGLSHGVGVGIRMAFDVNSSQFGFIPLVNKSWEFKEPKGIFKRFFVEADLPVKFNRPTGGTSTTPVTFATHFGLGF